MPAEQTLVEQLVSNPDDTMLSDGVVVLRPFRTEDAVAYVARQDDEMRRWFDWPGRFRSS
ncbi:MAG: hypothetical protein QM733_22730 [Ilumatobacteraceae bacterium]